MRIKHNNSLYCPIPPEIIEEPPTPTEFMEDLIREHLDEENEFLNGFLDIDEIQCSELIKWKEREEQTISS